MELADLLVKAIFFFLQLLGFVLLALAFSNTELALPSSAFFHSVT